MLLKTLNYLNDNKVTKDSFLLINFKRIESMFNMSID